MRMRAPLSRMGAWIQGPCYVDDDESSISWLSSYFILMSVPFDGCSFFNMSVPIPFLMNSFLI